jgi:hypothetical protein
MVATLLELVTIQGRDESSSKFQRPTPAYSIVAPFTGKNSDIGNCRPISENREGDRETGND